MANNKLPKDNLDVVLALEKVEQALSSFGAIFQLPRRIGARVRWPHNGLAWERVNENGWRPLTDDGSGPPDPRESRLYESEHIARYGYETIEE